MGLHLIDSGTAQPRIEVMLRSSSTGQGATGIAAAAISACTWQVDGDTTITDIALADAAYPPAYAAGRWSAIDPARKPGAYLLDLPAAVVAAANKGKAITLRLTGTGFLDAKETILVGPLSAKAVEMLAGVIDATAAPNLDAAMSTRAAAATAVSNADLTAARIEKMDNLDGTITSRAPASTAVSNATLTAARIAKLDNLDAAITTRAPANTAVSNADLTAARITKLDNLDATMSSRVAAADLTLARIQRLDNLDATVTSRAPASTAVSNADLTAVRIGKLDNLDTTVSSAKASGDAAKASADAAKTSADSAGMAATAAQTAASTAATNAANANTAAMAAANVSVDIAAVTAKLDTMMVLSGAAYQFTAAALALSPASGALTVLPLATTLSTSTFTTSGGNIINLVHAQNSRATYTFAVFDGEDNPVDLSGKDLELAVHTAKGLVKFSIRSGAGVVIGGASNNQVAATVSEVQAAEAGLFYYKLWNLTDRRLLAAGSFRIPLAPVVP